MAPKGDSTDIANLIREIPLENAPLWARNPALEILLGYSLKQAGVPVISNTLRVYETKALFLVSPNAHSLPSTFPHTHPYLSLSHSFDIIQPTPSNALDFHLRVHRRTPTSSSLPSPKRPVRIKLDPTRPSLASLLAQIDPKSQDKHHHKEREAIYGRKLGSRIEYVSSSSRLAPQALTSIGNGSPSFRSQDESTSAPSSADVGSTRNPSIGLKARVWSAASGWLGMGALFGSARSSAIQTIDAKDVMGSGSTSSDCMSPVSKHTSPLQRKITARDQIQVQNSYLAKITAMPHSPAHPIGSSNNSAADTFTFLPGSFLHHDPSHLENDADAEAEAIMPDQVPAIINTSQERESVLETHSTQYFEPLVPALSDPSPNMITTPSVSLSPPQPHQTQKSSSSSMVNIGRLVEEIVAPESSDGGLVSGTILIRGNMPEVLSEGNGNEMVWQDEVAALEYADETGTRDDANAAMELAGTNDDEDFTRLDEEAADGLLSPQHQSLEPALGVEPDQQPSAPHSPIIPIIVAQLPPAHSPPQSEQAVPHTSPAPGPLQLNVPIAPATPTAPLPPASPPRTLSRSDEAVQYRNVRSWQQGHAPTWEEELNRRIAAGDAVFSPPESLLEENGDSDLGRRRDGSRSHAAPSTPRRQPGPYPLYSQNKPSTLFWTTKSPAKPLFSSTASAIHSRKSQPPTPQPLIPPKESRHTLLKGTVAAKIRDAKAMSPEKGKSNLSAGKARQESQSILPLEAIDEDPFVEIDQNADQLIDEDEIPVAGPSNPKSKSKKRGPDEMEVIQTEVGSQKRHKAGQRNTKNLSMRSSKAADEKPVVPNAPAVPAAKAKKPFIDKIPQPSVLQLRRSARVPS